jgi:hypothetical protein
MDQKQRDKIAWGITILFVPVLIYLLTTNIAKVRKSSASSPPPPSPPPPALVVPDAAAVPPSAVAVPPGAEVQPPRQAAPIDSKVSAEQKRIAMLLPKNNPFNPARPISADPSPVAAAPDTPAPSVAPAPPPAAPGIKLTAIVSRQGGAARMAMINGRFLGEGDHIANWTIIKVNTRDVLLQDGARQMVLKLK